MIFIDNKYHKVYEQLIKRAQARGEVDGLCEVHHIIPRCMGGSDDSSNLVKLTLREHFIAHKLLPRFTTDMSKFKLNHAWSYMVHTKKGVRITSHDYDLARKIAGAKGRPQEWRDRISASLSGRKPSPEAVEKMRKSLTGMKRSDEFKAKISAVTRGRKHSEEAKYNMGMSKAKEFIVINPDGVIERVKNLKDWAKSQSMNYNTLVNNSTLADPISRGPLKGWNVKPS